MFKEIFVYFKNKKRLETENLELKKQLETARIVTIINTDAHNNLLKQLHQANLRIVEFTDIKKAHLVYVEQLKKGNKETEKVSDV